MVATDLFLRFGAALGIGILIGLQREFAYDDPDREIFAGVRTFALLALLGCLAAYLSQLLDSAWVLVATGLVIGALITAAYVVIAWRRSEIGLTTEVAALLTILIGALCFLGPLALATAIGVTTTVLLALKPQLHNFVRLLSREDIYATLRFAVIAAIVLPVLPNRTYGPPPLDVLNPYQIWLMVIFISGISFLGYVLIKVVGPRQGIGLTGLLGGLASSTAVTLSFSQRSQRREDLSRPFALAIIVAWTMMFPRILVEVRVVNASLLNSLWLPIGAAGAAGLLYAAYLYFGGRADDGELVEFTNPFDLGPAIKFGFLYALILLISRAVQISPLGEAGILFSSLLAGLVDVDAITLSVAQLSSGGGVDGTTAVRAIVLAAMANTGVKGIIIMLTGSRALRRALWPGFLLIFSVGVGVAFLM